MATILTIPTDISWSDPDRHLAFDAWLNPLAAAQGWQASSLTLASADASARRYFRIKHADGHSAIVMDAPPDQVDTRAFVELANRVRRAGLHAPEIHACDEALGFALIEDLGTRSYLDALRESDSQVANQLMRDAIRALIQWQVNLGTEGLALYDEAFFRRELALFPQWCVEREFGLAWTESQRTRWQAVCDVLVASAVSQPVVPVHRDYMPRNLLVADPNPGIIDFQDALAGPITYDIASLLRDAFVSWEEEREIDWAVRYWESARKAGLQVDEDFGEFWRQLEWMGLQRHLKVMGIFCRLKHRDGKPQYRDDLPRFFTYATRVAMRYRPLAPLLALIEPMQGAKLTSGYTF